MERKLRSLRAAALSLFFAGLGAGGISSSHAASVTSVPLPDGSALVTVSGEIDFGDHERLRTVLGNVRAQGRRVAAVRLDSIGGLVPVGMAMADIVRREHLATIVEGTCASACFGVFAAGRVKLASSGAKIGVHMPWSYNGPNEKWASFQAAQYRSYGVPDSIVAKMESTPPSAMGWLTPGEQRIMGVRALGL